jgi:membrane protein required for colicin V production
MNWLDWTIVAILALSTLLSLTRGFVKEALSLLAWVAAFLVSTTFSGRLASQLVEFIANDSLRYASAYVLLFAATLMLGSLLNMLLAQLIKVTGLSGLDRLLGTVFGFARGLVVVLVLLFILRAVLPVDEQQRIEQSLLVPHLALVDQWARQNFADAANSGHLPWL